MDDYTRDVPIAGQIVVVGGRDRSGEGKLWRFVERVRGADLGRSSY